MGRNEIMVLYFFPITYSHYSKTMKHKTTYRAASFLPGFFLLVCLVGCGDNLSRVTGTVTFNGEPLAGAAIMFTSTTDGINASGVTNQDGVYTLQTPTGNAGTGAPRGTYLVTFSKFDISWDGRSYFTDANYERQREYTSVQILPRRYVSSTTSPFTVEINQRVQTIDFDLPSNL